MHAHVNEKFLTPLSAETFHRCHAFLRGSVGVSWFPIRNKSVRSSCVAARNDPSLTNWKSKEIGQRARRSRTATCDTWAILLSADYRRGRDSKHSRSTHDRVVARRPRRSGSLTTTGFWYVGQRSGDRIARSRERRETGNRKLSLSLLIVRIKRVSIACKFDLQSTVDNVTSLIDPLFVYI